MAGEAEGDDKKVDLEKKVADLTSIVSNLAEGMQNMQGSIGTLTQNMTEFTKTLQQGQQQQQQSGEEEDDDSTFTPGDADLESMSRADFMNVILQQVNKGLGDIAKQLETKVSTVEERVDATTIKAEIKEVADQNPDFMFYKDEMKAIADRNPEMHVKDIYRLAKAEVAESNPEKLKEIEEKVAEQQAEKLKTQQQAGEGSANQSTKKGGFGGLTPTSGQQTDKPTNMTPDAAAEAAWSETMEGLEEVTT